MSKQTYVYVSSWKKSSSDFGLSGYKFDPVTGVMEFIEKIERNILFNFTYYDKKRCLLYALEEVNDLPNLRGGGGGRLFVFRIDPGTGKLTEIERKETWCASPSYLTLDETGRFLMISHHGGHSCITKIVEDAFGNYSPVVEWDDAVVELFAVNEDGTIGKLLDVNKHLGDGPEKRQMHARPHTALRSPSGELFAVCDKGNDTVCMYMLDREKGKLIRPKHVYKQTPGTLPRYCVFHPEKPWFYHNSEDCLDLYAFQYREDGLLQEIGIYNSQLQEHGQKEPTYQQQGLVIDSKGHYIYDIVRGPNVVAVYEINQQDGTLTVVQNQPISGIWPRGCAISPDGKYLLVCCLDSEKVIVFGIGEDGLLYETGNEYVNHACSFATFCEM